MGERSAKAPSLREFPEEFPKKALDRPRKRKKMQARRLTSKTTASCVRRCEALAEAAMDIGASPSTVAGNPRAFTSGAANALGEDLGGGVAVFA